MTATKVLTALTFFSLVSLVASGRNVTEDDTEDLASVFVDNPKSALQFVIG